MIVIPEETLGRLDRLVHEIGSLHCKLALVIGPSEVGKSKLLAELAKRHQTSVLSVGAALGRALLSVAVSRRHLQAPDLLRELSDNAAAVIALLVRCYKRLKRLQDAFQTLRNVAYDVAIGGDMPV
jgi:hypothetical protein